MRKLSLSPTVAFAAIARNPQLMVLMAAGSLTTMTGAVFNPALGEIKHQLQLAPEIGGYLAAAHVWALGLFSLPLGILSDRVGRVKVLIVSLLCYAVFGAAGVTVDDFLPLIALRGCLGIATAGITSASLGLLTSMYEGEERAKALGYATGTLTLAGIVFPLLGGGVGYFFHWRYIFCLYAIGLPLAVLTAKILPQPPERTSVKTEQERPKHKLWQVLGRYQTIWLLLTLSLTSIVMYSVVFYTPQYFKDTINANTLTNSLVLASRALGAAIISAFGARRLSQSLGLYKATAIGFILMALTLSTIPFLREIGLIMLAAVGFGAGFGLILPNLYDALASLAPSQLRSSVLSAGAGAGFIGQSFCPIVLGFVVKNHGIEAAFFTAASASIVVGMLLLLFGSRESGVGSRESGKES
ncbi:MFS transporter [cyanobacterium TDX16]|nr:MFS transporter [cyanobacterium TDX16]